MQETLMSISSPQQLRFRCMLNSIQHIYISIKFYKLLRKIGERFNLSVQSCTTGIKLGE